MIRVSPVGATLTHIFFSPNSTTLLKVELSLGLELNLELNLALGPLLGLEWW